jgi:hypothetical protein
VRSFYDANDDYIGNFRGLIEKLYYYLIRLEINAIWLLPFYPSPLKDNRHDISYYYDIRDLTKACNLFSRFQRRMTPINYLLLCIHVLYQRIKYYPPIEEVKRPSSKLHPEKRIKDSFIFSKELEGMCPSNMKCM